MDFCPVTSALIGNINGTPAASLVKEVKCEVCGIMLSSYVVLLDHRAGRKHKNQLKTLIRSRKINLNCTMCGILSKNFEEWELHVTSENHVEKLKRFRPPQGDFPPPQQLLPHVIPIPQQPLKTTPLIPPLLPSKELLELTEKFQLKLNQEAIQQIFAKDPKERKDWNCISCKVKCQSQCSWDAHVVSHKHRKNKHKFHTYPGISKEYVKNKYQNSFVRAAETIGNEFIEDGVVFYCKRCDVRMQNKAQLGVHMSSNQHKMNHPIAPPPIADPYPNQANPQLFNFESSSYGYGFRNWAGEQHLQNRHIPQLSQVELQKQQDMERQNQLVEQAKNELLARFPFYAINLQTQHFPDEIPMPVEAPRPVEAPPAYPPGGY